MKKILAILAVILLSSPCFGQRFSYTTTNGGGGGSGTIADGGIEGQVPYWDNTGLTWTPMTGVIWEEANGSLVLGAGSATDPALAFADGTTGFYQPVPGNLYISVSGTTRWRSNTTWLGSLYVNGASLRNNGGSSTVPNVIVSASDSDTGIGPGGLDALSLIAGGVSGVLITETAGLITVDVAGILTATDTTGPQCKMAFDALNFTTFETDSNGDLFISSTGDSNFIGYLAGSANTGTYATGVGYNALRLNTVSSTGVGSSALLINSGVNSTGVGAFALWNNTGANASGVGLNALRGNTGAGSTGVGHYALSVNAGVNSTGIGPDSLRLNTGTSSTGAGSGSLRQNVGVNSTGVGALALRYNTGNFVTALGNFANSEFLPNISGDKIFAFGDVNATTNRVTVTSHGFGPSSTWTNVLYTEGTSAIAGLVDDTVYQVWVADANTVGFWEAGRQVGANITDAGAGTGHTLTPQFAYDDVVCIGNNSKPTGARQVIFNGDHDDMIVDMNLDVAGTVTVNGLIEIKTSETVADDAFIDLPTGVSGWGTVSAGDNQEHTRFWFSSDGTVTLSDSTANVVNTDTDANLCVFDGGAVVRISNRLGAPLTLKISAEY